MTTRGFQTPVTDLFKIDVPIIQGAMAWLSEAELVAAVSNQGGLGVLGASIMSVEEFESQVVRTLKLTDKPFGVNFPLVLGQYDKHLEMCLDHGVRIVFMSAGSPKVLTPTIKARDAVCVHVVPSKKLALRAVECGVDAVVLESFEAGGHLSPEGITGLTNIPMVAGSLPVPLIAAGGITNGRQMAAAMTLGADGVQMGTRFLATHESNAPEVYQRLLLEADETDTPVFSKAFHPGRALRSPILDRILALEDGGGALKEVRTLIGRGRAKKAAHEANLDEGLFYSGAGAALVTGVCSVEELFAELLTEYDEALDRASGMRRSRLADDKPKAQSIKVA